MSNTTSVGFSRNDNNNRNQAKTQLEQIQSLSSLASVKTKVVAMPRQSKIMPNNIFINQGTPHSTTSMKFNSLQLPNLPLNQSIKRSYFINSDPPEVKEEKKKLYSEILARKVANPREIALPSLFIRPPTPFDAMYIDNEDRHLYTQIKETPRTMAGKIQKLIDTSYEE